MSLLHSPSSVILFHRPVLFNYLINNRLGDGIVSGRLGTGFLDHSERMRRAEIGTFPHLRGRLSAHLHPFFPRMLFLLVAPVDAVDLVQQEPESMLLVPYRLEVRLDGAEGAGNQKQR